MIYLTLETNTGTSVTLLAGDLCNTNNIFTIHASQSTDGFLRKQVHQSIVIHSQFMTFSACFGGLEIWQFICAWLLVWHLHTWSLLKNMNAKSNERHLLRMTPIYIPLSGLSSFVQRGIFSHLLLPFKINHINCFAKTRKLFPNPSVHIIFITSPFCTIYSTQECMCHRCIL